jgi:hypothetical protein
MLESVNLVKGVRPPVNPYNLSFEDPTCEKDFLDYHTGRTVGIIRFSVMLAIVLYISFALLDYIVIPSKAFEVNIIRVLSIGMFLGLLFAIRYPAAREHIQFLVSTAVLFGSMGIIMMIFVSEDVGGSFYYAGLILASMFAHVLLRLRFVWSTLITWFIIFVYISMTLRFGITPHDVLINNAYFLVSANIMGMFASYWLEYYMRAVYWQNKVLGDKRTELEAEHLRKSRELEAARQIQIAMLPSTMPNYAGYDIAMGMRTATEVGGDFYDYTLPDCGAMILAVGDATGHGAQAGAMVTATKILFTDHCRYMDLGDFMSRASRTLRQQGLKKLYMAFGMAELTPTHGIKLIGAGLPPALVYRRKIDAVEEISMKGMPLGAPANYPYKEIATDLGDGDVLLMYTDGLPELFNDQGDMLGYESIAGLLKKHAHQSAEEIKDALLAYASQWSPVLDDDVTIVVAKRQA